MESNQIVKVQLKPEACVADAIQWDGKNNADIKKFLNTADDMEGEDSLIIFGWAGPQVMFIGDWVVHTNIGHFEVYDKSTFIKTFNLIQELK